jgi:hypothetical protein
MGASFVGYSSMMSAAHFAGKGQRAKRLRRQRPGPAGAAFGAGPVRARTGPQETDPPIF